MEFEYNRDFNRRENILFGEDYNKENYHYGGSRCFTPEKYFDADALPMGILTAYVLLYEKFLNPEEKHNEAPTAKECIDFCTKYPQVYMHGYAISPERKDYRISIEGLVCVDDITEELKEDFKNLSYAADEVIIEDDILYSWYD